MKYEAKNIGGVATSQAALTPWDMINQTSARTACFNLGTGYHLITNVEWVTIARLAENDPTNWADGVIGSTVASGGGLYRGNVNLPDSASCGSNVVLDGNTPGTNCIVGSRNKRTLNISGQLIWDLVGNVWDWLNNTISANTGGNLGKSNWNSSQWPTISGYNYLKSTNYTYDTTYGIGEVYTGGQSGTTLYGFIRGGAWYSGFSLGGIFSIYLNAYPNLFNTDVGFRCAYSP